jgi:molybdate transport system substrate-binding protein
MKRTIRLSLLAAMFLIGCSPVATRIADLTQHSPPATEAPTLSSTAAEPKKINVFAAASLTNAFTEIGVNFETANPGTTVTFNFAGSQALQTQIEQGAPVDVFAPASKSNMDTLVAEHLVAQDTPQLFLNNKLVVILPKDNPAGLESLEDLSKPGIKFILAAEAVPVGKYARQALDSMDAKFQNGYETKVFANVVSNEDNVKQVVAKVQLGEADAGIVYTSDAVAAPELKTIEIPDDLNVIARYPIAPLVKSENPDLASAFIAYVLSTDGQAVLQKWGFAPAQ